MIRKLKPSTIIIEYNKLKIDAYQIAGTKSKFEFFFTTITKIEKLIGIVRAIKFPNNVPDETEFPIIIETPDIAKTIEKPTKETFFFKYIKPNIKNIVCVLIINTTFATEVFIIAKMKAIKLKDITNHLT